MLVRSLALLAPVLTLLAGCAEPSDPLDFADLAGDSVSTRCVGCSWGPPVINTQFLDQEAHSELDTQGEFHDGWRLVSVSILIDRDVEIPLVSVWAENGVLYGVDEMDTTYAADQFLYSRWTVSFSPADPTMAPTDLWYMEVTDFIEGADGRTRYTFNNGPTTNAAEAFNCEADPETGERTAVMFANLSVDPDTGTHEDRPNTIYMGCTSGAVGKAAMWGYAPHFAGPDAHQTATRAVRADYCGDGESWTQTGTPLQVSDAWDYNLFADAGLPTEAMWGPEGAMCLLVPRRPEYEYGMITCPGETPPMCDELGDLSSAPGSLLWTKIW